MYSHMYVHARSNSCGCAFCLVQVSCAFVILQHMSSSSVTESAVSWLNTNEETREIHNIFSTHVTAHTSDHLTYFTTSNYNTYYLGVGCLTFVVDQLLKFPKSLKSGLLANNNSLPWQLMLQASLTLVCAPTVIHSPSCRVYLLINNYRY